MLLQVAQLSPKNAKILLNVVARRWILLHIAACCCTLLICCWVSLDIVESCSMMLNDAECNLMLLNVAEVLQNNAKVLLNVAKYC